MARYYETRLAGLLRLTQALRGPVVFLEAEALLADSRAVLDQLAVFLELQSPLTAEYRRFAHTGEVGFGDPWGRSAPAGLRRPRARAARRFHCRGR